MEQQEIDQFKEWATEVLNKQGVLTGLALSFAQHGNIHLKMLAPVADDHSLWAGLQVLRVLPLAWDEAALAYFDEAVDENSPFPPEDDPTVSPCAVLIEFDNTSNVEALVFPYSIGPEGVTWKDPGSFTAKHLAQTVAVIKQACANAHPDTGAFKDLTTWYAWQRSWLLFSSEEFTGQLREDE